MNDITDIAEVYDLLYRLGFSTTNTAFFQLSYAVYHNFGTPLIGSVFCQTTFYRDLSSLGSGVCRFPFYFANDNFTLTFKSALPTPHGVGLRRTCCQANRQTQRELMGVNMKTTALLNSAR